MNNIFVKVLSRIFDFILLNLLWLVCSLPILTLGASTTALYSVMFKITVNEEGYLFQNFLKAFQVNFKQSTVIWLILLIVGVIIRVDFTIISGIPGFFGKFGLVLLGIVTLFWIIEISFAFPLIAKFENTTKNMMKNAILIPVSRLPYALMVLALTGACLILTFLNEMTMMTGAVLWSLIGMAILTYVHALLFIQIFKPYLKR